MSEVKHKKCFKCGETKPLSAFYKHPRMADGRVNKCKECNKTDVKQNRESKSDYYREFDRERNRYPSEERRKSQQAYQKSEKYKESKKNYTEIWIGKYPERRKASLELYKAFKKGLIERPNYCQHCGKEGKPEAHHPSYSEDMWLEVVWLCSKCHGEVHREYD